MRKQVGNEDGGISLKEASPQGKRAKSTAAAPSESALNDFCFCITGTLSVSRKEFEDYIQANGGAIAETMNGRCTHLVCNNSETQECPHGEAFLKGITVVNEEWVRKQVDESSAAKVEVSNVMMDRAGTPDTDRAALIQLWTETGGPEGSWNATLSEFFKGSSAPLSEWHCTLTHDPTSFRGVRTNEAGRVIYLSLCEVGLTGRIPACIGALTELRDLRLCVNSLVGPIPPSLQNCRELNFLNLQMFMGSNELTDPRPSNEQDDQLVFDGNSSIMKFLALL